VVTGTAQKGSLLSSAWPGNKIFFWIGQYFGAGDALDLADAGIADEGHTCPPLRPAIILFDFPPIGPYFRTEDG